MSKFLTMDVTSLQQHLRIAAEQYERDARMARKCEEERAAKAFDLQAEECREFCDGIDNVQRWSFVTDVGVEHADASMSAIGLKVEG